MSLSNKILSFLFFFLQNLQHDIENKCIIGAIDLIVLLISSIEKQIFFNSLITRFDR